MRFVSLFFALTLIAVACAQTEQEIQIDPETGRAIGAKEMPADELRKLIDRKTNTLVIDVREPDAFEKETIKGAINIPLGSLKERLKDMPKDVTLVFT